MLTVSVGVSARSRLLHTSRQSAGDAALLIHLEPSGVAPILDDGHKACTAMGMHLWKGYWSG